MTAAQQPPQQLPLRPGDGGRGRAAVAPAAACHLVYCSSCGALNPPSQAGLHAARRQVTSLANWLRCRRLLKVALECTTNCASRSTICNNETNCMTCSDTRMLTEPICAPGMQLHMAGKVPVSTTTGDRSSSELAGMRQAGQETDQAVSLQICDRRDRARLTCRSSSGGEVSRRLSPGLQPHGALHDLLRTGGVQLLLVAQQPLHARLLHTPQRTRFTQATYRIAISPATLIGVSLSPP